MLAIPGDDLQWPNYVNAKLYTYLLNFLESELHYNRRSVGQSVLVSGPIWVPRTIFHLFFFFNYFKTDAGL
jgi:hypothetical protein